MNTKNKHKKENKLKRILMLILIALVFLFVLINIQKSNKNVINKKAVLELQLETPSGTIDISSATTLEGNFPRLGAGMIPVIYNSEGNYWEITTADNPNWYDYKETGKWASAMLSDGYYQAEATYNTKSKELATPGTRILENNFDDLGTIFTWIPRLCYKDDEVLFLNGTSVIDYYYTTNTCFNEELFGLDELDIGYEGFWVGRDEYESNEDIEKLNIEMSKEENNYGLIKNEAISTITNNEKLVIEKLKSKYSFQNTSMIKSTNLYRQIIKIVNPNRKLPMTVTHKTEGMTTTLSTIYNENEILFFLDENGNKLEDGNKFVPDDQIMMTFYGVDEKGNMRGHLVKFTNIKADLTGFNPNTTFYVTYDEFGNEDSSIPIGEPMPNNWNNYYEKRWANVVTRNDGDELYFTWIPRYQYKLDKTSQKVIAEFIEVNTEPTEGYQIPEAFTWTDLSGKTVQLKGYWMSKYKLSSTSGYKPNIQGGQNVIDVKDIVSRFGTSYKYYAYLIQDGKILRGPIEIEGDYTFEEVLAGDYVVNVMIKDANGKQYKGVTKKVTVFNPSSPNPPNLAGFNKNKTFYVTYDANGKEESSIPIGEQEPENWYNYDKQQWANLVVRENGLENYYVWIPRYQYKLDGEHEDAFIDFIPASKSTPDEGYQIANAFVWENESGNKVQLEGYWMSKYELRDDVIKRLSANVIADISSIRVDSIKLLTDSASSYELSILQEGVRLETVTLTGSSHVFENLEMGSYTIHLIARDSNGIQIAGFTKEVTLSEPESPDLTGFNPDTTFYVTYDEDGNEESVIPIGEEVPENWYNYRDKQWANIVVRNNGDELYYVWIPRYQYTLDSTNQKVITEFIPVTKTTPSKGYQIPEAFSWVDLNNNTVQLKGYWMTKYKLATTSSYRPDIQGETNCIKITNIVSTIGSGYTYNVYLIQDGVRLRGPIEITGDYTIEDVPEGNYSVLIDIKNSSGKHYKGILKQVIVFKETQANAPDLAGFNPSTTFYVTYDANGKEQSVIPIGEEPPENWYNYSESKWANLVVRDSGMENYYVWVPRYQYWLDSPYEDAYVEFIPKSKTTADDGYKIPDAFTWMNDSNQTIQLAGYWMSKYELRDDVIKRLSASVAVDMSSIRVKQINSLVSSSSYEVSLIKDGIRIETQSITSEYTFKNLEAGTYVIHLVAKDSSGNQLAGFTKEVTLNEPEVPDVTGFNVDKTYIITEFNSDKSPAKEQLLRDVLKADANIGSDGGLISGEVDLSKIDGTWYDYQNQKWANVVTKNNGDTIYFVWIPRYEYQLDSTNQKVNLRFIPVTKTTPDTYYKIPEAFSWTDLSNKTVALKGYWMTKYKLSSTTVTG